MTSRPDEYIVDVEALGADTVYDPDAGDPVQAALDQAAQAYRATRALWGRSLGEAREGERAAQAEATRARGQADAERRRAAHERDRANRMAEALKDVHRAVFGGNVYELILRACMTLTGATRGVYLTVPAGGRPQARAAVDVDGYPRKEPSAFITALCAKVIADEDTFVCNDPHEFAAFPKPDGPGERFADCLVAPAVLLEKFNGVVILADKPDGFDDDDTEAVLAVGDQAGVAVENCRLKDELFRSYFSVVGVLADAVEAKDPYTHGHSEDVARLARRTAERLAPDPELHSLCCFGGLLHDIGKIGVSDGVLNKPGKLLPEEWELMKSHVRTGRDLLARIPALDGVADVVLYHHERYDGGGYPDGLAADRIPLAARVVGVADAYCAMIAKRSYKESMTPAEARDELVRCKGTHFDPAVVDAFVAALDVPANAADCSAGGCDPYPLSEAADIRHALRLPKAAKKKG